MREVLMRSTEPTTVGKMFVVELYSCKYFRTFSVYEIILKRIMVVLNYPLNQSIFTQNLVIFVWGT